MFKYSVEMLFCMMGVVSPFMFCLLMGASAAKAYAKVHRR